MNTEIETLLVTPAQAGVQSRPTERADTGFRPQFILSAAAGGVEGPR
jgi:hypothetical protein